MDAAAWLTLASILIVVALAILKAIMWKIADNKRKQQYFDILQQQDLMHLLEETIFNIHQHLVITDEQIDRLTTYSILLGRGIQTQHYQTKLQRLIELCFSYRQALIKLGQTTNIRSREAEYYGEEISKTVSELVETTRNPVASPSKIRGWLF